MTGPLQRAPLRGVQRNRPEPRRHGDARLCAGHRDQSDGVAVALLGAPFSLLAAGLIADADVAVAAGQLLCLVAPLLLSGAGVAVWLRGWARRADELRETERAERARRFRTSSGLSGDDHPGG